MTEKDLQKVFVNFLKDNKIYHIKTITCTRAGAPDVIACIDGNFVAFELKSSTGKESLLQKYNAEKIRISGGKYFLVTPENYKTIIDRINNQCTSN